MRGAAVEELGRSRDRVRTGAQRPLVSAPLGTPLRLARRRGPASPACSAWSGRRSGTPLRRSNPCKDP